MMTITILNNILIISFFQLIINYIIAFFLNPRYKLLYKKLSYIIVVLFIIVAPLFDFLWLFWHISLADNISIGVIDSGYTIFKPLILIAVQFIFNTFILKQILNKKVYSSGL